MLEVAPGYISSSSVKAMLKSAAGGMAYHAAARRPFEPFLREAAACLSQMPLYRHLRDSRLVPEIKAWNLEGTVCEMRKPNEDARGPRTVRTQAHLKPGNELKRMFWEKLAAL